MLTTTKLERTFLKPYLPVPNNAPKVTEVSTLGVKVSKGPLLDGVGQSSKADRAVSKSPDADAAKALKAAGTEVMVNLLPSGATKATQWYAEQALAAGCAFVNATPNFFASDAAWAKRFAMQSSTSRRRPDGPGWLNCFA